MRASVMIGPVIHDDVSAAIVAGGQARRLGGRDKGRLEVRGRPIIVRQIEVLQRVTATIFIVSSHTDGRFVDLGLPVYPDAVEGVGAIGGLLTALERASTDLILVVGCDLPFLQEAVLERLVNRARTADAAWIMSARGPEPLLACYRRAAAPRVRQEVARGRLRLADLDQVLTIAAIAPEELAEFGDANELLANINTADDLGRIQ